MSTLRAMAIATAAIALLALQASPAAAKVKPLCAPASPLSLPSSYPDPAASLTSAQSHYLALAENGVNAASRGSTWWNSDHAWYNALLTGNAKNPLAQVWDAVPLFESVDEIAIADPNANNLGLVRRFVACAEKYWDGHVPPHGAYAPYAKSWNIPKTFFDDNTWWSLAFMDGYSAIQRAIQQVTGSYVRKLRRLARRMLRDAIRGFDFISGSGWDSHGGGLWWNTSHDTRSGEVLGGATELAAGLYAATHHQSYLRTALKYIRWANHNLLKWDGQYSDNLPDEVIMPHDGEGMMIDAFTTLCQAGASVPENVYRFLPPNKLQGAGPSYERPYTYVHGEPQSIQAPFTWCDWADSLAFSTVLGVNPGNGFQDGFLPFYQGGASWEGPQWDAIYIRGLLALYAYDHIPLWYRAAVTTAKAILRHARSGDLFTKGWDGSTNINDATPGLLRTHAASVSVFAALATVAPPAG